MSRLPPGPCGIEGCQHAPACVTPLRPDNVRTLLKPRLRSLVDEARLAYDRGDRDRGRDLAAEAVLLALREREQRA